MTAYRRWTRLLGTAASAGLLAAAASDLVHGQGRRDPDWARLQDETLQHYQAVLRMDTSDPPGNEKPVVDYLEQVLTRDGIAVQRFEAEPNRINLVARLKGNGRKKPLLLMGHTDVVTVDPKKWTYPPFSATRNGGYVYARGAVDDKSHVAAFLMVMLELKRLNVPLDRDVIFLAEAGEEGTTRVGIEYMVAKHFAEIDAEFCYAEGGTVARSAGRVQYASIQSAEKIPHAIELTATGISGHGSVPLQGNAIGHLSAAIAALVNWKPPVRLNDTTREYFTRMARLAPPADAARYRAILDPSSPAASAAVDEFARTQPRLASMLRSSISPTIIQGGYRVNVIPSEARATLDVRLLPSEDPDAFIALVRGVVNDPSVRVEYGARDVRPPAPAARLDTDALSALQTAIAQNYDTVLLPTMSTGATDMAYLREKGIQCYGTGPAVDVEDGPRGFGAHSDQERLLEEELHRFVRFSWDAVVNLARAR
ncbi:MAG TPA: M20/M25/M40 family metallo-hydrolase [Vicinamibacterales bacterium]|nr:M20/M25/M40 family metallo-hydrolase [Vicinamibacterales bacterium]